MRFVALIGLFIVSSVSAGPLQTEHLQESDGWKAEIQLECYTPGERCGQFKFVSTGCGGSLLYRGERDGGYVFQEKLEAGRCVPNCELWIAEGLDRYRESCRGKLSGSGSLGAGSKPAEQAATKQPAAPIPQAPAEIRDQVIVAGATTYRGKFRVDQVTGLVDGQGKVEWTNGNRYEGPVVAGKLIGKGRFEWKNGDRYEGDMSNAEPHGQGTYFWKSGDRYVGAWRNGRKHGQGRYYFQDGGYWEGEYANDQQTANGRLVWAEKKEKLSTASNNMVVPPDEPAAVRHAIEPARSGAARPAPQKKAAPPVSPCPGKLVQCMDICSGLIDTGENSPAQVCRKRCDTEFASCQVAQ